ncbi:MAG: hypothetical protein FWC48_00040 [Actinomycetia bacterium]|nr:hypothetical protein [Actinomycetes bacterium]
MPKIAWFKNERGSTSLAVVLAIMLALVLVAGSLQWYWTNSSSEDIQMIADNGALAAADEQSKIMQTIQLLDALLLTANLFGLVLHAVVVVAGVVAVASEGTASEFFEKALELDKRYCEKRKEFAQDIYKIAQGLNTAAPYLVMARSSMAIQQSAGSVSSYTEGSYAGVALPLPWSGQVELTGYSEGEDQLLDEVGKAHDDNQQEATAAQKAREEADAAKEECFRLDLYKAPGTSLLSWDPAYAYDDFKGAADTLISAPRPSPVALAPIDDNASTRAALQADFERSYGEIQQDLQLEVPRTIGSATPDSDSYPAEDLSIDRLLRSWLDEEVYVLSTPEGQRRAYHRQTSCFGLAGADATPQSVKLETLLGASEHPPCTICAPTDWRAISAWEEKLQPFTENWNAEAAALSRYQKARAELSGHETTIRDTTASALDKLTSKAGSYLLGGRLRYHASGARGFICIVVCPKQRSLPGFTLPPLTNSQGSRLAPQMALSAAKLIPSDAKKTLPSLLGNSAAGAQSAGGGLPAATGALLGADGPGGVAGAAVTFLLSLWGSCLDVYARGADSLGDQVSGLPFGLDQVMRPAWDKLLGAAQAEPPDLRYPQPVLVDTANVGSPDADGLEGSFVRTLRAAKRDYAWLGESGLLDLARGLAGSSDDIPAAGDLVMALSAKVFGIDLGLPFSGEIERGIDDMTRQLDEIGSL